MANNSNPKSLSDPTVTALAQTVSLNNSLLTRRVTDLRTIASAFDIKGVSRLAKAELAATLTAAMPQCAEVIRQQLQACKPAVLTQLGKSIDSCGLPVAADDSLTALETLGLVQLLPAADAFLLVVPAELQPIFRTVLPAPAVPADPAHAALLQHYASAAVSLYGALPLEELVQIFNQHNPRKTTVEEFTAVLDEANNTSYCLWDNHLVHSKLSSGSFQPAQTLIRQTASKSRYIPAKNDFLKYADADYFPENLQTIALERYLRGKLKHVADSKYTPAALVREIHRRILNNANNQMIVDALMESGIRFDGHADAQKSMEYIVDMHNNTRVWSNKGHTPRELAAQRNRLNSLQQYFSDPNAAAPKVGRNDPCPCGSGKKLKKCCG